MELITSLIEKIYSSLSAAEFTLLIVLAIIMLPMILKALSKIVSNKTALASLIGAGNDNEILKIQESISSLATKDDIDSIKKSIADIQEKIDDGNIAAQESKRDFMTLITSLQRDVLELSKKIESIDSEINHSNDSSRELLNKVNGLIAKLISQVDKIDEFAKTAVPEFRSYHKEISKDLSDLSRDVALVERTLQNQINNTNAVKLR
jgi:predicted  nucleic acid-binding Zn-ribbon protein